MDKNRELHELLGKCWHEQAENPHYMQHDLRQFVCVCGDDKCDGFTNPDYAADPRLVMKEVSQDFCLSLLEPKTRKAIEIGMDIVVPVNLILDTSGRIRDAAIEFLRTLEAQIGGNV